MNSLLSQETGTLRAALGLMRAGCHSILVDREMAFTDFILATTIPFYVQYLIWTHIYGDVGALVISGYTQDQLLFYVAFALVFGRLNNGYSLIEKGAQEFHEGTLDVVLVKPYSVVFQRLYIFLGESIPYLVPLLILCAANFMTRGSEIPASVGILAFLGMVVLLPLLQAVCYFLAQLMVCAAFFTVRSEFVSTLHIGLVSFLGGLLIPASFWPQKMQFLMKYNPYAYLIELPSSFLARPSLDAYLCLAGGTFGYLIFLSILAFILWNKVTRIYHSSDG